MTDVTMPQLSDSMESGTILSWLKADGDAVAAGDELVEIETDKATMTYDSPAAGTLTIVAPAGEALPIGAVIARVGDGAAAPVESPADEAQVAVEAPAAAEAPAPVEAPAAVAPPAAAEAPAAVASPVAAAAGPTTSTSAGAGNGVGPVAATPVARRLAAAHGVDLAALAGSGPRGRVTRTDVAAAAGIHAPASVAPRAHAPATAPAPAASEPAAGTGRGDAVVQRPTRLQQVVARRMAEAKATVPEFQVQTEVAMDAALELRAQLKAQLNEDAIAPSVNDLIVKASALALRQHPLANGSYRDDRFELHTRVNVGIAVAAPGALVVPVVTDADRRSLSSIAAETRRLAERVRDGSITPPELSGGTFTVSNLGMYGMTAITPVINLPQAAILGVGATRATLARNEAGEIAERQLMTLTLTCDHRILYGTDAAQFLAAIRTLLQQPLRLLM